MKIVLKILTALAAIAGTVYVIATYGDKIVAWAKNLLASCPCCNDTCEGECECECGGECTCEGEGECECGGECKCAEEVPAEEPAPEEASVEEEAPVEEVVIEENEPVAAEEDFAE